MAVPLRKSVTREYTPEQVAEIAACVRDPLDGFMARYLTITDKENGEIIPYRPRDYQRRMIKTCLQNDRVIIMAPRQTGKSTSMAAFLLTWALFKPYQTVLIASKDFESAGEVMRFIKTMYEGVPEWLKPRILTNNERSIIFEHGSRIVLKATTESAGRSVPASLVYLDELAFVEPRVQDKLWESLFPTLGGKGKMIVTSTPNVDTDRFARTWLSAVDAPLSFAWVPPKAEDGSEAPVYETIYEDPDMAPEVLDDSLEERGTDGAFRRFFVDWTEHYSDVDRKRFFRAGNSMVAWRKDYLCHFVSSDKTLIEPNKLSSMNYGVRPPLLVDRYGTRWFSKIKPNEAYAVALDASEGVGGDNACIQVVSMPSMEHVAEWASDVVDQVGQASMLRRIMRRICDEQSYMRTHIGPSRIYYSCERNGNGAGVLSVIQKEGVGKFPGQILGEKDRNGIASTKDKKLHACTALKRVVEHYRLIPRSAGAVDEFKTFVRRGVGYAAKTGCKDDRVMALALVMLVAELAGNYDPSAHGVVHVSPEDDGVDAEDNNVAALPMIRVL